jgi:hypothetical protein
MTLGDEHDLYRSCPTLRRPSPAAAATATTLTSGLLRLGLLLWRLVSAQTGNRYDERRDYQSPDNCSPHCSSSLGSTTQTTLTRPYQNWNLSSS